MVFWRKKDGTDNSPPQGDPPLPERPVEEPSTSWWQGLLKSSTKIGSGITDLFTKKRIEARDLEQLEDALIESDLGPSVAAKIVADFARDKIDKDTTSDDLRLFLADRIAAILKSCERPFEWIKPARGPLTVLVCGVNGAGKTTTIGKLAAQRGRAQDRVMLGAGDTFRAAAVDQLRVWAQRAGADFFAKGEGADSAALAYESYAKALADGSDLLMIDTAGRLQNKTHLMNELEKMVRVLRKHDPALPHAVWLVLDATTGQNALAQVEIFSSLLPVSGIIITKMDGTARGGMAVALADRFQVPIHWIGMGEGIEDLRPFDARAFANGLCGVDSNG